MVRNVILRRMYGFTRQSAASDIGPGSNARKRKTNPVSGKRRYYTIPQRAPVCINVSGCAT